MTLRSESEHSAGPPSNCELCSFIGQTAEHLEQHIFENHTYPCNQCDEIFTCEDLLTRHTFNQHPLPVRIKCCLCDYVAVDKKVLDEHLTDVHNIIEVLSGIVTNQKHVISGYYKFKEEVLQTLDKSAS